MGAEDLVDWRDRFVHPAREGYCRGAKNSVVGYWENRFHGRASLKGVDRGSFQRTAPADRGGIQGKEPGYSVSREMPRYPVLVSLWYWMDGSTRPQYAVHHGVIALLSSPAGGLCAYTHEVVTRESQRC